MSFPGEFFEALRKIILVQEKISALEEEVKFLGAGQQDLRERVARLEAKFELLERLGGARRKRLPSS